MNNFNFPQENNLNFEDEELNNKIKEYNQIYNNNSNNNKNYLDNNNNININSNKFNYKSEIKNNFQKNKNQNNINTQKQPYYINKNNKNNNNNNYLLSKDSPSTFNEFLNLSEMENEYDSYISIKFKNIITKRK